MINNNNNEYYFYNYNFKDIAFYQNKKSYNIFIYEDFMKEIIFNTPNLNIPFGIEDYNNKKILNLEFKNIKLNNNLYNLYSNIKNVESFFINLNKNENIIKRPFPNNLLNDIKNKKFISSIKDKENFDPLFRIHLKKVKRKYLTTFKKKKNNEEILYHEIKKMNGIFCICLKSLWISNDSYGLIWNLQSSILN
tara:strand:- start:161 stop:739 length:579 start_codon:yes stop_codon:yes gene_type:complete